MIVDLCHLLSIIIITHHSGPSSLVLLTAFFQHPNVYLTKRSAATWCAKMYSMLRFSSRNSVGVALAVGLQCTVEYAPTPWIDFDYIWHGNSNIHLKTDIRIWGHIFISEWVTAATDIKTDRHIYICDVSGIAVPLLSGIYKVVQIWPGLSN